MSLSSGLSDAVVTRHHAIDVLYLHGAERIEDWRRRGAMLFFHYVHNEERLLNYASYEDSVRHDALGADFPQPALIFQGLPDGSVDHRTVEAFTWTRPNGTLSLLDDDHQLIANLPRIWNDMEAFGASDPLGAVRFLGLAG